MGEDLSAGVKIAIILIILLAVISIVFSLLTIVKNLSSKGSYNLQTMLYGLDELQLSSYDQKKVSGAEVLAFISLNTKMDASVLISNERMIPSGASKSNAEFINYGVVIDCCKDSADRCYDKQLIKLGINDSLPDDTQTVNNLYYSTKSGRYISSIPLTARQEVIYNTNFEGLYEPTSKYYINPDHKYLASLIYDISGNNLGVYFEEEAYIDAKS